jgi:4-hydroxybenzoate polyprenyltransferase
VKNPYLTASPTTSWFGVTGQVLLGLGYVLPPPFGYIALGVGLVSTAVAHVAAQDRQDVPRVD